MTSDFISSKQEKKLQKYVELLLDCNKKLNLIGRSTEVDIWSRHILDSAQLIKLLSESEIQNSSCADFGTGAGIPGIILSILGIRNMTLIEKSPKKCNFLKSAVKISDNKLEIINNNIANIKNVSFDIIFSRALANMAELLNMVQQFLDTNTKCIFLKGKKLKEELVFAEKFFNFEYEIIPSETSSEGNIIVLNRIKPIENNLNLDLII